MNLHKQLFTGLFLALMVSASAEIKVTSLTTDYKSNPIGIGNPAPMLSWIIQSDQYNTMQESYEIRAAADPRDLSRGKNLIWDSGKISSQQSVHIKYGGQPLSSYQRVYWQVRVVDNHGKKSKLGFKSSC